MQTYSTLELREHSTELRGNHFVRSLKVKMIAFLGFFLLLFNASLAQQGEALDFDGFFDYVESTNNLGIAGNAARTMECWVKVVPTNLFNEHIINWGGTTTGTSFGFYQTFNSELVFYGFDAINIDYKTGFFFDNNWHHIAASFDGTTVRTFVDGVETPVSNQNIALFTVDGPLVLGAREDIMPLATYSNLQMDEVRIWNRALCQAEIIAQMNCELVGNESNLVLYYNFNQGIAGGDNGSGCPNNNPCENTVQDLTSNNNDGILDPFFTLNGPTSNFVGSSGAGTGPCPVPTLPIVEISGNGMVIGDGDDSPTLDDHTDFGGTGLGSSITRTFTITNVGTASLNLTGNPLVEITGANAADFSVTVLPNTPIAPSNSTTFTIEFSPSFLSTHSATIGIDSDDCILDSYTFDIQGTGLNVNGPANVSNGIKLWLTASDPDGDGNPNNNPSDGSNINTWTDISGNGNNATVLGGQNAPVYGSDPTEQINGQPVLQFSRVFDHLGSVLEVPGLDIRSSVLEDVTIITVYRQGAIDVVNENQGLWGVDNGDFDRFYLSNFVATQEGGLSVGLPTAFVDVPNSGVVGLTRLLSVIYDGGAGNADGSEIFFNGHSVETTTDNTNTTDSQTSFRIGFDGDNSAFNGDIAEVIVYCRKLTDCEIEQINIELGNKYGSNFVDLSPHYDFDANYGNDINGIGKLVTTACGTTLTIDEAESSIITIDNPSSNNIIGEFLTLGHDGAGFGISTETPAGFDERIQQVWRADEDGNLGTVDICFDMSNTGISLTDVFDLALLIDTDDGNFSNSTVETNGASLSGNTICFTGINFNNGDFITLATKRQKGKQLWFRADEGVNNGGAPINAGPVDQWENQLNNPFLADITQNNANKQPNLQSDVVNFNPAVQFDGNDDFLQKTGLLGGQLLTTDKNTAIFVGRLHSGTTAFQFEHNSNNRLAFELSGTKARLDFPNDTDGQMISGKDVNNQFRILTLRVNGNDNSLFVDGNIDNAISTVSTADLSKAYTLQLGKAVNSSSFAKVDFAELMVFNEFLTSGDRNIMESYLALKYGITLEQGFFGQDYIASDGNTKMFNAIDMFGFLHDVTGIGRDDNSDLNQKQSQSVNTDAIVAIGLGSIETTNAANSNSFDNDLEFLTWANDDGAPDANNTTTTQLPAAVNERMTRIWKVEENNGDVGDVEIQFDLTGLGFDNCYPDVSDYFLLIDSDTDFSDATAIAANSYNNDVASFQNIDFEDGDHFTIAFNVSEPDAPSISGDLELCFGEMTTLTLSGDLNDADEWHWYEGTCGNVQIGTGTSIAVSPGVTTTYSVRAEGTCLIEPGTCTTVTVVVHPTPDAAAASNSPICEDETLQLFETAGDAAAWNWEGPDNFSSNSQNPTIVLAKPIASGTYHVTITDIHGCTNTASTDVTVFPKPQVDVSSNSPICEDETLQLFETAGDALAWNWDGPDNFNSNLQNPSIVLAKPIASGTYQVTITDINGCTNTASTDVTVFPKPQIDVFNNSPVCEGALVVLQEQGNEAISWQWSGPNGFSSNLQVPVIINSDPSDSGIYSVTITDINTCTNTASTTVIVHPTPDVSTTSNSPICEGDNLQLQETAGDAVSWLWSGPNGFSSNLQNPTIVAATPINSGTYNVTITDINGCVNYSNLDFTVHPTPDVAAHATSPICEGDNLLIEENAGDAISWQWTGPDGFSSNLQSLSIADVELLNAGTYQLTITDVNTCTNTDQTDVIVHSKPTTNTYSNSPICEFEDMVISLSGGNATSWDWTGPNGFSHSGQAVFIPNATVLNAGIYSVTIEDANNCTNVYDIDMVIMPGPPASPDYNAPACVGKDLELSANSTGALFYNWTGPNGFASNQQNPVIPSATSANSGTYTLIATDGNTCYSINTLNIDVNEPSAEAINNGPLCSGEDLNLMEIAGDGVSWLWSGPNGFSSNQQNPTINNVNLGNQGNYSVTITNSEGCTTAATTDVVIGADFSAVITSNAPVCVDEALELNETSGQGVSWQWSGPNGFASNFQNNTLTNITLADAGTYTVTVTNSGGCSKTAMMTITVLDRPLVQAENNGPVCEGTNLELNEVGGDAASWIWDGPNGFFSGAQSITLNNIFPSAAGTYSVTITAANGCTNEASTDVIVLNQPDIFLWSNSPVPIGGDIELSEAAGDANLWSWAGPNGFSSNLQNPDITNVGPLYSGDYFVTITAPNGCTNSSSINVLVTSDLAIVEANDPLCEGETLALMETGGFATSWLWTGPNGFSSSEQNPVITNATSNASGLYSVTVNTIFGTTASADLDVVINPIPNVFIPPTDDVCEGNQITLTETGGDATNWQWTGPGGFSSNEQNPILFNPVSGNYSVIIEDANNCTNTASVNITVLPSPNIEVTSSGDVCEGASIELFESGGAAANWQWTGPNNFNSTEQNPLIDDSETLNSGLYEVLITDNNGCTNTESIDLTVYATPTVSVAANHPLCEGADLELNENGGAATSWQWTGPNGFASNEQNPQIQNTDLTNAGNYAVSIIDQNGCANSTSLDVQIRPNPNIIIAQNDPLCEGDDLQLNEIAGDAIDWQWNGPGGFTSNEQNPLVANASAGAYEVLVTDAEGCTSESSTDVTVFALPTAMANSNASLCEGASILLEENGGQAVSWQWSGPNGFSSSIQNPVADDAFPFQSGTYHVTITDANSCTSESSTDVIVHPLPAVLTEQNGLSCENGVVEILESAGDAISWQWIGPNGFNSTDQSFSLSDLNPSNTGTYTVIITDVNACENSAMVELEVHPLPEVATIPDAQACENESFNLVENGGEATQWQWSGPAGFNSSLQNPTLNDLDISNAGTYQVVVTDDNGCSSVSSTLLTINTAPMIGITGKEAICVGEEISLIENEGAAVDWSWMGPNNFNSTNQQINIPNATQTEAGLYSVAITGANGCTNSSEIDIEVRTQPNIEVTGDMDLCEGMQLQLSEVGGEASNWLWEGPNGFGATNQNPAISNITTAASGNYSVSITDDAGCQNDKNINITVNPSPGISASSNSPVQGGDNLNLTENGGTAVAWQWSGPNGFSSTESNPTITNVTGDATGFYNVVVTDDNGCTAEEEIFAVVAVGPITVYSNSPLCEGEDLMLNEIGGQAISWQWEGPNGFNSSDQFPIIAGINPSQAGTYSVTITDDIGTTHTADLNVEVGNVPDAMVAASITEMCQGGTIELMETGGNATEWTWTGPAGFQSGNQNPNFVNANSNNSGNYTVTVSNDNGCTASADINITVFPNPEINIETSDLLCEGANIQLNENGGAALSWQWSGPGGFQSSIQNPQITNANTALSGTYAVSITDDNNCSDSADINLIVNPLPMVQANNNSPVCENTTLQLEETQGDGIAWSWVGPGGLSSDQQNPFFDDIPGSAAGVWTVMVTDGNGCANSAQTPVQIDDAPSIAAMGADEVCLGEAVQFSESGGEAQSWQWTGPNGFSSSEQNPELTDVPLNASGLYAVEITGSNGCIAEADLNLMVHALPNAAIQSISPPCEGADLELEENGNDATSWLWNGPNGFASMEQNPVLGNIDASNSGLYEVLIEDANGCANTVSLNIDVFPTPEIEMNGNGPLCEGDDLMLTESAGDAVDWVWEGPNFFLSTQQNPVLTGVIPNDGGLYELTITDANGCTASASLDIPVNSLPVLEIDDLDNFYCFDNNSTVLISGTPVDGNFSINSAQGLNDLGNGTAELVLTDLVPGDYWITYSFTDINGCANSIDSTVTRRDLVNIDIGSNAVNCEGEDLELTETGGSAVNWDWTGPNSFTSNDQNPVISNVPLASGGIYSVVISDDVGCTNSDMLTINIFPQPNIAISSNDPLCEGTDLNLMETGGDAIDWQWTGPSGFNSNEQSPSIFSATLNATGDYILTITGSNGCTAEQTQSILINALPQVDFLNLEDGYCQNLATPSIINSNQSGGIFTISGGQGLNDNGNGSAELFPEILPVGTYELTFSFTDVNNCSAETTQNLEIYDTPDVVAEMDGIPCNEQEHFTLLETGGDGSTWEWSGPSGFSSTEQNPTLSTGGDVNGLYTVLITDDQGCTNLDSIDIELVDGSSFISNFLIAGTACAGDTVHLIEASETTLIPTAIFWDLGDGNTSTDRDPVHIYENAGDYMIQVEVFDEACGNLSIEKLIEVQNCRRTAEPDQIIEASVFPNPTSGDFRLNVLLSEKESILIEIFDAQGQLIQLHRNHNQSKYDASLTLEHTGIYLVKVRTLHDEKVFKVLVYP